VEPNHFAKLIFFAVPFFSVSSDPLWSFLLLNIYVHLVMSTGAKSAAAERGLSLEHLVRSRL